MTTATAKPVSLLNSLRLGWPALLVIVVTFIAAEVATGTSWGGGPVGGVAGGVSVGGVAWVEAKWPDASPGRKRAILAVLAFAVSILTLAALLMARKAGVL